MGIDWAGADTDAVIDHVLTDHPHIAGHLREAHEQARLAVDPVLLELARLRVAMLLGATAELRVSEIAATAGLDEDTIADLASWPTSLRFGARERACLEFVEQWVLDVASITDAQAGAVADVVGPDGLAAFAAALLVIEQRLRLRLAWTRLFGETEAA